MIKYNLNNINKWYLGNGNPIAKMYHGSTVAYDVTGGGEPTPPTPPQSDCYGVTYPSITAYSDTTYSSVYSFTDGKWYMLNNLNQYEEYGVYDVVNDILTATTYEGKLAVVGEIEYQFNNGSWEEVGTYVDASVTYTIDNTDPSPYVGQELLTTFKIPYADVESVGYVNLRIRSNDGGNLGINLDSGGYSEYRYDGSSYYRGTVTNDGEYFYLSLPSEAPQSIVINLVDYWNSTPIHLVVGSKQASVKYEEKAAPSSALTYSSVADMEAAKCPDVGVGQLCYTDGQTYKFTSNDDWVQDSNTFIKQFYDDGRVGVLACGYNNNVLSVGILGNKAGTTQSSDPTIEVIIGDCVTTIDDNALYGLRNMSACTIGSGVTSIGDSAFTNCYSLTTVNIPNSVTSIGNRAFQGCTGLTSCTIGSGVTSIGDWAFSSCSGLTSIDIPNSVTSIGANAFNSCGLTSITIPDSVTSIGANAFDNTPWWNTYSADTSHRYGNIIYLNDIAYKATSSGITSCTFREGTVSIGGGAFYRCSKLTSIDIPDSVTSIGNDAFNYCSGLTSIVIPDGVTSIGDWAFSSCSGLTSCTIGSGVTSIGGYALFQCKRLTSITCNAVTPPTLGSDTVFDNTNSAPIYVPAAAVSSYQSANYWNEYSSRIRAIQT